MPESKTPATTKKTDKEVLATTATTKNAALESDEPRNFLATFLLTTVFGMLGLRHFYLGDIRFGWIRSGLFVGGIIWMVAFASLNIAALTILGWLATTVAIIWGIVDFFYVYFNVRRDAHGRALVATTLDRTFATVIFWVAIAIAAAALIALLIALSVGQQTFDSWSNDINQSQQG
ncbi:MAG TPA: hypothetical protein VFQ70_04420, partial [Candidatus Saccharimonadaceae bacterium]|nr:hypothetical protein [Candidatus Saccharimonadaceae bacterium]